MFTNLESVSTRDLINKRDALVEATQKRISRKIARYKAMIDAGHAPVKSLVAYVVHDHGVLNKRILPIEAELERRGV